MTSPRRAAADRRQGGGRPTGARPATGCQAEGATALSEAELVARLQAGDSRAAEDFVRAHSGWMLTVARRYVLDDALAEDCVQDAFLSAFRRIGDFEGRARLKSWLHRIVVNAALARIRSRRRRNERSIEDLLPTFDTFGCRVEATWPDVATPVEALQDSQTRELVAAKIQDLPDNYRIVLLLRDIEELSIAETAALLHVSEGAVKTRLHRARSALKFLLEPVIGAMMRS